MIGERAGFRKGETVGSAGRSNGVRAARIKGLAIVTGNSMRRLGHIGPGDGCANLDGERRWTEGETAARRGNRDGLTVPPRGRGG